MKILIIGSSGFIGTNVVLAFKDRFDILCIDLQPPKVKVLNDVWIKVDITDLKAFRQVVVESNPDYILHLAARTDLDGRELGDYAANIVGVRNLMKIASELTSLRKIVITSSMLVCHTGYYPKNQFDYAPSTMYGESKVETENAVWNNKPQCDWAIIRPTSIWGPWFGVPYRNFFDMVMSHCYFHIGRKSCTKTYGYVGNAVYQIEQILFNETRDENRKVFYIGDNPPTNIEDWANEIADELGYKVKRIPWWLLRCVAWGGDLLKQIGISFPMTSFRLKNMTTDNIIDLSATYEIAPNPPYSRKKGIKETLKWLESTLR
ncbi:NAD(P)-dependent oxidoreductase [Bacteroides helcogenes]|uniref:NAD-dependent epimerase/dehydratase n=1 Tax=Bacteroides helcogenes (strain ATCC 35417 / DSM 20613 / JCM 6297 / CCUG 15421 / P 36-108) TaxID=693979 RepID=E6SS65_BACT6|nr:NAD(P)-dependent oxidoreductase [Bacteroides helcogenes]ADV44133.1 NAD-dependent epimerase/dehydratase [Bacteroides helcogenes P 36-108]MDY5237935.1 NAD(P)-dependent oxidoreductase [Bacteroides helcogenes]